MTVQTPQMQARSPRAQLAALGVPLLIGGLSSSSAGFIDTVMMGHYGAAALAAVSAASAWFDIFSGIVLASLTGHQILAARFAGREDPAGIARSLRSSAWFCGGIALVLIALSVTAGRWLTGLITGGNAHIEQLGAQYLTARAPTLLLLVPFTIVAAIFNAYKKPRTVMTATIIVNVVNLAADFLLIFGLAGLPRLGATGNGLATTIAWGIGVVFLLVAAQRFAIGKLLRQPPVGSPIGFVTSVSRLSWPAIVSTGLDYASMAVFFAIVGRVGANPLAGGRIAFELVLLLFGIGSSFAAATRILIGRALGAERPGEVKVFWRTGIAITLIPAVLITFPLVAFPYPIAELFTSFHPVAVAAASAIRLVGICVPLMAWALGNINTLRAFGKTGWDMYVNLGSALCLQLPLAWLFADVLGYGVTGAFLAVVAYWLARTVFTEVLARRIVSGLAAREQRHPATSSRPAGSTP